MAATAIIITLVPSLRVSSANKREVSPLCLKLLTTVCNSRYSGMMVLGESAQSWGRILWRCRAEQWLFRLLHSSRRRHICKGRGKKPNFMTFFSYKVQVNTTRDLIFQHFIISVLRLFYKICTEGQRPSYVGDLKYLSETISIEVNPSLY